MKRCAAVFLLIGSFVLTGVLALPLDMAAQSTDVSIERLSFTTPPVTPDDALLLPNPRGPYQVGTVTYHWVWDELEELTPSEIDRREVIAQLFYPAQRTKDGPPTAYVPELPLLRRGLLTHGFPPFAKQSEQLSKYARVRTAAWPDEPVLRAEGPFPVVLISPGGNMSRHWHTALSQELASQGYVVAVISHAHSGLDVFPGGGFLASNIYWHPGDDVPADEVARRDKRLANRLARDVNVVLDGLERVIGSEEANGLRGGLDLERIGIIGHSRGGSAITAACRSDHRIDACIIFDNIGAVQGMEASLPQPRLTVRAPWSPSRSQRLATVLADSESDAFEAVIQGADHYSFTDLPLVDPEGYPSEGIAPTEAHNIVAKLTLAFLDRYLLQHHPAFLKAIEPLPDQVNVLAY